MQAGATLRGPRPLPQEGTPSADRLRVGPAIVRRANPFFLRAAICGSTIDRL